VLCQESVFQKCSWSVLAKSSARSTMVSLFILPFKTTWRRKDSGLLFERATENREKRRKKSERKHFELMFCCNNRKVRSRDDGIGSTTRRFTDPSRVGEQKKEGCRGTRLPLLENYNRFLFFSSFLLNKHPTLDRERLYHYHHQPLPTTTTHTFLCYICSAKSNCKPFRTFPDTHPASSSSSFFYIHFISNASLSIRAWFQMEVDNK